MDIVFIAFEDGLYVIPEENPDQSKIIETAKIYKRLELNLQKREKKTGYNIFQYKYENGKLTEGRFIKSI